LTVHRGGGSDGSQTQWPQARGAVVTLVKGSDGAPDEERDDDDADHELAAIELVGSTSSSLKGCYSGSADRTEDFG
jgi:hypothetical protein